LSRAEGDEPRAIQERRKKLSIEYGVIRARGRVLSAEHGAIRGTG